MTPKSTLELKSVGDPSSLGEVTRPEAKTRGGRSKALRRRPGHQTSKQAWFDRARRRSAVGVSHSGIIGPGEERALAESIKAGDSDAEQKLVTANLGLVLTVVNSYLRCGVPEDDLIQEGNLGLIRAARRFDPSTHPTRFATYATYWIRCFMMRALVSDSSLIKCPRRQKRLKLRDGQTSDLPRADRDTANRGLVPKSFAVDDLSQSLAGPREGPIDYRVAQTDHALCQSLNHLSVADPSAPDVEVLVSESRLLVWGALRKLSPFEAWVIRERFGLGEPSFPATPPTGPVRAAEESARAHDPGNDEPDALGRPTESYVERSYLDMGRDCGLSVFRLRQVEMTALGKLRRALAGRVGDGA